MCGCGSLHPPTAGHVAKGLYCTWLCWNLHLSSSDLSYLNLQAAIWYPVSTRFHSFLFQVVFCFALTTFNNHFYSCLAPRPLRLLLNPGPQLVHLFGIGSPGQFHIFHLRLWDPQWLASWASNFHRVSRPSIQAGKLRGKTTNVLLVAFIYLKWIAATLCNMCTSNMLHGLLA